MPTRSRKAASNSSSPRMARSVMAAICGFSPAMSASSSRHSTLMMVESMSAISSFFLRCAVATTLMSSLRPSAKRAGRGQQRRGCPALRPADRRRGRATGLSACPAPGREQFRRGALADDIQNKGGHAGPMKYDAVLIAGPTASGKSAAALALAEHIGGVVINADSMQVYREAPILTAQPDAAAQGARAASALWPCLRARALFGGPLCRRCARGAEPGACDGHGCRSLSAAPDFISRP